MARKPTPWFPVYALELLEDEKLDELTHRELGMLLRLWCKMWQNGVKRGTLLLTNTTPISDKKVADFLHINLETFLKFSQKLVNDLDLLKRGKCGELFSQRLRKFKTNWELYGRQKRLKQENKKGQT